MLSRIIREAMDEFDSGAAALPAEQGDATAFHAPRSTAMDALWSLGFRGLPSALFIPSSSFSS